MASSPARARSRRTRSRTNEEKQKRATHSKVKNEPPIVLFMDSSSASEVKENNPQQQNEEDEEEEEMESKRSGGGNNSDKKGSDEMPKKKQKSLKRKQEKQKKEKQKQGEEDDNVEKKSENNLYKFPIYRVEKIIRSENPDYRISQEAMYVIDKAAEMFVEIFSEDAHAASATDRKKLIDYKHLCCPFSGPKLSYYSFDGYVDGFETMIKKSNLKCLCSAHKDVEQSPKKSSVVCKRRRLDFLSDFVPGRLKAEDALAQAKASDT
ncbi:Transcription factor CBF/NF-Y/archaeal histone domain [Dillenia turbinata]|uniref:Transcription factor CBF/NF-Y/archaeal histone domain n=1 Tax=Dillenia turbinata TaxID=194707 RepID=A0AAN8VAZ5_9MAGN